MILSEEIGQHRTGLGIQQNVLCERLAQIGDAPGVHRLIARVVVAQCSAVNVPPSGNSTSSRIDGQA
jgi:hypothetical protein